MIKQLFAAVLLFFCIQLNAQSQHQIKVGIGDGTALTIGDALANFFEDVTNYGTRADFENKTKFPYLFVDYRYAVSEIVNIGLQAGYVAYTNEATYEKGGVKTVVNYNSSYFALMPGVDLRYYQNDKLRVYGNGMIGALFASRENSSGGTKETGFVYQINPIGVSYGNQTAVFAEAGFGISLINVGVKFGL